MTFRQIGFGGTLGAAVLALAGCKQDPVPPANSSVQPDSATAAAVPTPDPQPAVVRGPAKIEDLLSSGYEVKAGTMVPQGGGAHIWLQKGSSLYYCYSVANVDSWDQNAQIEACREVISHKAEPTAR